MSGGFDIEEANIGDGEAGEGFEERSPSINRRNAQRPESMELAPTVVVTNTAPPSQQDGEQKSSTTMRDRLVVGWRGWSYWWASALLIFSLVIVIYGISMQWNNPAWKPNQHRGSHPMLEILLFIFILTWMALLEGCQISIVGLQGIDLEPFKDSHPRAYKTLKVAYEGPNVERFLVGRQFLLLLNGFLACRVGGAAAIPENNGNFKIGEWEWEHESLWSQILWSNSFLLIIIFVAFAQLPTQLLAFDKMLGFINLPFMPYYTILMPTLCIESLGLTHSSYLLKDVLCWAANVDRSQEDPKKAMTKDSGYYSKCALSVSAVTFCGIFLFKGWLTKQTGATHGTGWEDLPGWASIMVSVLFLFIMACAEGLQMSALMLARTPTKVFKGAKPKVYRTLMLLGGSDGVQFDGRNMKAFLVGRQFVVAIMVVMLARVTGYGGSEGVLVAGSDWGMDRSFNEWFLQTGFCGAVFVVNVAQLATQVTASVFPVSLINNHLMYGVLQLFLLTEASGLANSCYPLMWFLSWALRMEKDPQFKVLDTYDKRPDLIIPQSIPTRWRTSDQAQKVVRAVLRH